MGISIAPHLLAAALSGGAVSWAATWLNEKSKSRAYIMGAVDKAVGVALESATKEIERLNKEVEKLRESEQKCKERNIAMEAELTELRASIDGLMNGKVAYYAGPEGTAE